jgi:hypothetical protein
VNEAFNLTRVHRSIVEIENDVPVSIDFDHVLEFRVRDDGDGLRQSDTELEVKSNGSLTRQIHVIVLSEIRSEVIGEKSVSVGIIRPTNVVSFVPIYLVRTPEQARVRDYVSTCCKIRLQRF